MAVENGESKNEKNNTRCMTLLDAAKLIEGQERGIDRERERGGTGAADTGQRSLTA